MRIGIYARRQGRGRRLAKTGHHHGNARDETARSVTGPRREGAGVDLFFPTDFLGFRTHVVATTVCTTRGVHTLTCCTHIFSAHSALTAYFAHFSCVCTYTHGSSVCKKVFAYVSFLSISPSPFSCFTVSAVPAHPLQHHLSVHNIAVLSRPESAGHAQLRTCIAKFGYLAKSDANTGYEPKKVRQDHFCGQ